MLRTRIITALALLAGFLFIVLLLPKPAVAAVFGVVAGLLAWEWAGMMAIDRAGRFLFAGVVLVSCLAAYNQPDFAFPKLWLVSALFWLVVAPLWLWRRWPMSANDIAGYAAGWLLIVPTWSAMVALQDRSPWWLFAAMALVWVADIAAYFAGRAFGRHKLAPAISPGKTWEGVVGAIVGVFVYGFGAALVAGISPLDNLRWMPLLVVLTGVSIIGDLFESLVKRQAGLKDSSNLLPGHGGFLDRLDSQTSTLPLVALIVFGVSR